MKKNTTSKFRVFPYEDNLKEQIKKKNLYSWVVVVHL